MLGESWLNEELGSERSPNPLREGETASITSVVGGFIRNDMGFSRKEVSAYANQALLNEAHDILGLHSFNDEVVHSWMSKIEHAQVVGDSEAEQYAQSRLDELQSTIETEYNIGRAGFAEAVQLARSSRRVLLSQETCRAVVSLDHDGYMSEAMDVDVPSLFGDNPAYDPEAASRAAAQTAHSVDFSRSPRAVAAPAGVKERTRASALERIKSTSQVQPDASREPIKASKVVDELMARLQANEQSSVVSSEPQLG